MGVAAPLRAPGMFWPTVAGVSWKQEIFWPGKQVNDFSCKHFLLHGSILVQETALLQYIQG
jgi:hypothetical protein